MDSFDDLLPFAETVAGALKRRGETVAVSESSSGGLVAAALLAQPGASAFFLGAAVVYTAAARTGLLGVGSADMEGIRSASEPYALLAARTARQRLGADWGIAETGAAGPAGNRYGDAPGHCCLALAGPAAERATTLELADDRRLPNMLRFAAALLQLFAKELNPS